MPQRLTILFNAEVLTCAGEINLVPLRSAFPLHAKKKPPVSGNSKSHAGAGLSTRIADEDSPWKCITCTKCKKIRS